MKEYILEENRHTYSLPAFFDELQFLRISFWKFLCGWNNFAISNLLFTSCEIIVLFIFLSFTTEDYKYIMKDSRFLIMKVEYNIRNTKTFILIR